MGVSRMVDFDLPFLLTFGVSLAMVLIAYIDMRKRLKEQQAFSKLSMELLGTLKEELKLFREKPKGVSTTKQELKRQKILADREKQQWKQMKDVAKAIGWILEHTEDDF